MLGEPDELQDPPGLFEIQTALGAELRQPQHGAQRGHPVATESARRNRFQHRDARRDVRGLERAGHAGLGDHGRLTHRQGLPVQGDLPLIHPVEPTDHVQQRRLAGSIRTDERGDPTGRRQQGDVLERGVPAESLVHAARPAARAPSIARDLGATLSPPPRAWV